MNVFQKLGVKIADFGKWFAGTVKTVVGLALLLPFGWGRIIDITASEGAVTANGLNFTADSKVYSDFLTLIDDFKKLAPVVEQAILILEGKPATTPAAS